jgi:hypothetical protein
MHPVGSRLNSLSPPPSVLHDNGEFGFAIDYEQQIFEEEAIAHGQHVDDHPKLNGMFYPTLVHFDFKKFLYVQGYPVM